MASLIVEDGSIVANANSYVDIEFARNYADSYGLTLPVDDDTLVRHLLNSQTFLGSFEPRLQGSRVSPTQRLSWPRAGVDACGTPIAQTQIPESIKSAQVELAALITSGIDLFATISGRVLKREKVDVLEQEFSEAVFSTADGLPKYPKIEALLGCLFIQTIGGYRLTQRHGF